MNGNKFTTLVHLEQYYTDIELPGIIGNKDSWRFENVININFTHTHNTTQQKKKHGKQLKRKPENIYMVEDFQDLDWLLCNFKFVNFPLGYINRNLLLCSRWFYSLL